MTISLCKLVASSSSIAVLPVYVISPPTEVLPAGWERHESDDGPYYWHIKSGTIQLEAPEGTVRRPASPGTVSAAVKVRCYLMLCCGTRF